jgi:hypothetical protein
LRYECRYDVYLSKQSCCITKRLNAATSAIWLTNEREAILADNRHIKVKFTSEQASKAPKWRRRIVLPFV